MYWVVEVGTQNPNMCTHFDVISGKPTLCPPQAKQNLGLAVSLLNMLTQKVFAGRSFHFGFHYHTYMCAVSRSYDGHIFLGDMVKENR